ncbi:MAG: Maf family protein [Nitrospinota bacterium]
MTKVNVILASASPRRKRILSELFAEFDVRPVEIDESPRNGETHRETAKRLSMEKAQKVAEKNPGSLVIGADTFVFLGGNIIGKADCEERARGMLAALSGKTHEVITGVSFIYKNENFSQCVVCRSEVKFKNLSENDIDEYLANGEYVGKAGAYAIQGAGKALIESFSGSFTNIVGLPVRELLRFIVDFGFGRLPLKVER